MFKGSVISYPNRGQWGNSKYRGNCSGHVIKDFVETYHGANDSLFADPSVGGGTSRDVAESMGLRFKGLDLHNGYNLLTDSLATALGEQAKTIFWHPPYHDMIHYSDSADNGMWGNEPHPGDLSRQASLSDFIEGCSVAFQNIYDALENGGHYGILIGNQRKKGKYYNLSSMLERFCPGELRDEIIKIQHNCVSDRRQYSSQIVRIEHEKLLVFKKIRQLYAFSYANWLENKIKKSHRITWRAAIRAAFIKKPVISLSELYQELAPFAKTKDNKHPEARIRAIVQDERYFTRVDRGTYSLAA